MYEEINEEFTKNFEEEALKENFEKMDKKEWKKKRRILV
jgi:hypothetical protein